MPETATAASPNAVTIADAGPSRKRLTIEIPAGSVSDKLREQIDTLAVEAQLPGFRKGRAPRQLVERRFGTSVRAEATRQLVAEAYAKAVEDHKLKVIGDPIADQLEKLEAKEGQPLRVDVEVEVMPEFTLPSLDGIEVRKPTLEVTDEMVNEEVTKLCVNEGGLEERTESEPGDYLTGHGVMKGADGAVFHDIKGCVVQVPKTDRGMILGIMVDDFAKQLGRPKPGQTVTVNATGPENHEIEGVRNAKLTVTFAVERVDRIIPAPLADLVQRFGFENDQQLRDTVRSRLSQRVMIEQQAAMRQQVAGHLLERTEVPLPERLTAQQAGRALERQRLEWMYRGVPAQQIEERMAELRAASSAMAADELKLFFILNKAAEDLKVQVAEAEINGRIAQLAIERNVRPEQLRQELMARNQVGVVFQQVREHKTYDAILAKASITEVPAEELRKASGGATKGASKGKKAKS